MDIFEAIQNRFSCRSYNDKDVKDELIFEILKYANLAPSAGNLQTWRFIIIKDKKKKEALVEACLKQDFITQAPVLLIVCGDLDYMKRFYKNKGELYCIQECAAVTQNILLAATGLGLASCWIGAFEVNMVKRILNIPENVMPYAIVTLGYTREKIPEKQIYGLDTKTYFNNYGNKINDKSLIPLEKNIPKIKEKSKNLFSKLINLFKKSE